MEITPTPIIYIEDIRLNDLSINGVVFSTADDGTYIPEAGAFVYVYINDILSNERIDPYNLEGIASRSGYVTTTNSDGTWVCPVSSLRSGQRITAVAHSAGKAVSEPSSPYRVGSLPTPIDIHVVDRYGQRGPIRHGQVTIEGFFEGLHNRKYDRLNDPADAAYLFPYNYNFNLCPYIDGIKQECLQYNEVWSRNFLDQTVDVDWNTCFTILVQSVPVEVCLGSITATIYNEKFTYEDLQGHYYLYINPPVDPENTTIIHVYRNGLRLVEGFNEDYTINIAGTITTLVFNPDMVPSPDDIYMCDYLVVASSDAQYYVSNKIVNSTLSSFSVNKGLGLQVFRNGLRLKDSVDFSVDSSFGDKIVYLVEPLLDSDVLELAYFNPPGSTIEHRIESTGSFSSFVELIPGGNGSDIRSYIRVYKGGISDIPQMISIYKNGLHLAFGEDFDYRFVTTTPSYIEYELSPLNNFAYTAEVNPDGSLNFTITDNVVVELFYAAISESKTEAALNSLTAFIDNKIHADVVQEGNHSFLVLSSPYTLEFQDGDSSYYSTFGKSPSLIPGKDEDGNFKYFIDFKNNRWRYTFNKPVKRLQSITAATFFRP